MAIVQSLVTLPQCYNNQDYHWSVESHSGSIIGSSCFTVGHFIRVIICEQLISTYVELRFNVGFCRNAVHATLAQSETLGQDQHGVCGSNGGE